MATDVLGMLGDHAMYFASVAMPIAGAYVRGLMATAAGQVFLGLLLVYATVYAVSPRTVRQSPFVYVTYAIGISCTRRASNYVAGLAGAEPVGVVGAASEACAMFLSGALWILGLLVCRSALRDLLGPALRMYSDVCRAVGRTRYTTLYTARNIMLRAVPDSDSSYVAGWAGVSDDSSATGSTSSDDGSTSDSSESDDAGTGSDAADGADSDDADDADDGFIIYDGSAPGQDDSDSDSARYNVSRWEPHYRDMDPTERQALIDSEAPQSTAPYDVDDICDVCYDPVAGFPMREAPCGHIYHSQCVTAWLHVHLKCPMCGESLVETVTPRYRRKAQIEGWLSLYAGLQCAAL